jgi:hypothetical protein
MPVLPQDLVLAKQMAAIKAQAYRYGQQIRALEDVELYLDRQKIRRAWVEYRSQLRFGRFARAAFNSYYDGYCE